MICFHLCFILREKYKSYMMNNINVLLNRIKLLYIFLFGEKKWALRRYKKNTGKNMDLANPKTLNEKIIWLKLNYFEDHFIQACDKYLLHSYLMKIFGKDYAPELLFVTQNLSELQIRNIPEFPCIIKVSNGSGSNLIVRNKDEFSDDFLRNYFRKQIFISNMHAILSSEHQYLKKNPYIVVEKLLEDQNGRIPNDYKFLYINGSLEFIYCSVDRLGKNVRQVYDKNWNRLHFVWLPGANRDIFVKHDSSPNIPKPVMFDEMCSISSRISDDFPLVRVDFYETCNKVYVGEITLHHGSGCDKFYPEEYDKYYGEKLTLPVANRKV